MNRSPLAALCLAALLGGCFAAHPELYPHDPPPNIAAGQVLLELPRDLVEALTDPDTLLRRDQALAEVASNRRRLSAPGIEAAILAHQVTTGMTVEEVLWTVGGHPSAVRDQGPPGGHTLLWEPPGVLENRRLWVRFDEFGKVSAAGTH